jgi:DNA-binding CsgD family transcriptional regulator
MLNLNQSNSVASRYPSKETTFNISNRVPPTLPEDGPSDARVELHAALGRLGCAHIVLKLGHVVEVNPTGRAILDRYCGFAADAKSLYSAVKDIVKRASVEIPAGSMSWLATSLNEGITTLVNQMTNVWPDETCTIVLLDLDARPEPSPRTLQRLFGLTAAETHLAIELARGGNLLDISRSQRLSRTTIRSHLASLFVKTQTRRQAELVSLLGRIALLP